MKTSKSKSVTPIEANVYKDRRTNIPTEELRDFVAEDENKPKTILYPRDTSLDPQLVWKGKDEQDSKDLVVPSVPIYIQEKIHPKYLVEDLRAQANNERTEGQFNFFADFNGISFENMVEFYQHDQKWANRMILGDSLLVMTSLAEKERLKGKVQMIYIDPPYGINFGSNWQVSTRKRDMKKGNTEDVTRQPEQVKAFRDTWKWGINSYLAYLRDRLVASRDLLTETGSIFVQISEDNIHLVRCLLDEVFGRDNFVSQISFRKKTMPLGAKFLERMHDYILFYAKDINNLKYHQLYSEQDTTGDIHWGWFEDMKSGNRLKMTDEQVNDLNKLPNGCRVFRLVPLWPASFSEKDVFPVEFRGKTYHPPRGLCWVTGLEGIKRLINANRIEPEGTGNLRYVYFFDDYRLKKLISTWNDTTGARDQKYVVETATNVIQRCLLMTTDPGDLALDITCGSGTTAYVAEQWGRRWITCDTSRVALALARSRLMSAKYPYYLLADSPEGIKKEAILTGIVPPAYPTTGDIREGFVYNRVPHITLKSIVNNPDIYEGMSRNEIDEAISRHAETETLYDQPYEDKSRVRVSGPFTVESLSPHRVISLDEERPMGEKSAQHDDDTGQFVALIIENLKRAGVQNTVKQERLKFDSLEPFAGGNIQAKGEYTDSEGKARRVAVFIGPQYGTVSPEMVKEAAKEAVQGIGHDILVICGFSFDPHVSEEAKRYGALTVLIAHMNPDLSMGDELLKITESGNLFMVFGEPDVDIKKQDGKYTVTIKGLDIYDPTTGDMRSHSTDDIACWFIDTDYNGESFFVRHAYFTDGEDRYEKLRKTLKADIDEVVWESLYSTVSRPFAPPQSGKIAIKVINHYGDEVLKVYEVK